jgi:hypothetical protein
MAKKENEENKADADCLIFCEKKVNRSLCIIRKVYRILD